MTWLVWIILAVAIISMIVVFGIINEIRALQVQMDLLERSVRVRHGKISSKRVSRGNPQVDSKARTVTRDTHDLPLTGRMSQGVHREKRKSDSDTEDN